MIATKEIRRIVDAFDFYEHPQKTDLFRKNYKVDIGDGSPGIEVTLFADFRKTATGQFYSDPPVAHESTPLIQDIKDAIAKLPENRNADDSEIPEPPGEVEPDISVVPAPAQTPVVPTPEEREVKVKGLDMPIPALGMTLREMGFHIDIDYYLSPGGSQIMLQKEGITKLAAFASRLPNNPIIISDNYEEVEFERDENGQVIKIRLRGVAWIGPKDNPDRLLTDEIDWDWSSAVTRAVIKNVKNGMRLAKDAEHKKFGLPHKDKTALAEALTPNEVEYSPSGMLAPKKDVSVTKILPLMSYLADVREFALRTCIGKMRSRMWSELLGLRSISAKEARVMREEVDRV